MEEDMKNKMWREWKEGRYERKNINEEREKKMDEKEREREMED